MVKKLPDQQLENYSHWLNERAREKSVTAFKDWLKDEVRFRSRKVKINAILDDAPNETILNEEVAGALGPQEPFQNWAVIKRNQRENVAAESHRQLQSHVALQWQIKQLQQLTWVNKDL